MMDKMATIKLEKRYPDIPEETVTEIFQRGYLEGWNNARERERLDLRLAEAIPIEWIEQFMNRFRLDMVASDEYALLHIMLTEWEKENGA